MIEIRRVLEVLGLFFLLFLFWVALTTARGDIDVCYIDENKSDITIRVISQWQSR